MVAHVHGWRRWRRPVAAGAVLLVAVACAAGPPEPLERAPGADMPHWVVDGYEPRRPLAVNEQEAAGDEAQTQPQGEAGTPSAREQRQQRPRVPRRITAVGQARHEDAAHAEREAQDDAERALQRMLDVRIRRALLRHVESLEGITSDERDRLRAQVWYLELSPLIEALPVELHEVAWDQPPEVEGPPVTFAEARVSFESVLTKLQALVEETLNAAAPPRAHLAELLAQQ